MRVYYLFLIFFVASSFELFSQAIIKGKITDEQGKPVSQANISVMEEDIYVSSMLDGSYTISNLKKGTYSIKVNVIGYSQSVEEITISNLGEYIVDFILEELAYDIDEVTVMDIITKEDMPIAVNRISLKKVEDIDMSQDIPMLLSNQVPSYVATSDVGTGVGYTGIRIRGNDLTRINLTLNGVPMNDPESHSVWFVNTPDLLASLGKIEVQRGIGTSTNGSASFGSNIRLLTKEPSEEAQVNIASSYGSFNTIKNGIDLSSGRLNNNFYFNVKMSYIKSDGYRDRSGSDLKSYYLEGLYKGEDLFVKALLFSGNASNKLSWYGIDKATLETNRKHNPQGLIESEGRYYENQSDNYKQDYYQLHITKLLSDKLKLNLALYYTYGRGYYEEYKNNVSMKDHNLDKIDIKGKIIDSTDIITREWLDNDNYGMIYNLDYDLEKVFIRSGFSFMNYYPARHFGEVIWAKYASNGSIRHKYYDNEAKKRDISFYSIFNIDLTEELKVFVDLQYRYVPYKANSKRREIDVNEEYHFFNPKFGINYNIAKYDKLTFFVGNSKKEPMRDDFRGNKNPKHESVWDIELSYKKSIDKLRFDINAFFMYYQNQLILTGEIDDTGAYVRRNVGKTYRMGLEALINIDIFSNLNLNTAISISDNKNLDYKTNRNDKLLSLGNTDISFSPNVVINNSLDYELINNLKFSLFSRYVSSQYMDNEESKISKLDGYLVNDLAINYRIYGLSDVEELKISLLINNLLDQEYVSNGYMYGDAYYFPQAGINVMMGLNLTI